MSRPDRTTEDRVAGLLRDLTVARRVSARLADGPGDDRTPFVTALPPVETRAAGLVCLDDWIALPPDGGGNRPHPGD